MDRRVTPAQWMEMALRALPRERDEQLLQRLASTTTSVFWRRLSASERDAQVIALERVLRDGLAAAPTRTAKAVWFASLVDVARTGDTLAWLTRVWKRDEKVEGLPLAEPDETNLAFELALRGVDGWPAMLDGQQARVTNPDRAARFAFVRPALDADPAIRDGVFAALATPENRRREPWVLDVLTYLHHPLRGAHGERYVAPSLDMLEEIRRTGDIFFPKRWMDVTLGWHRSPAVAATVRGFLAAHPDYPDQAQADRPAVSRRGAARGAVVTASIAYNHARQSARTVTLDPTLLQQRALADQLALKDRALDVAAEGVTIADARLPDRPLIYANEGFERITGYAVAEVLGRNCRFLQGPGTDPVAVAEIRAAVAEHRECVVEILNYRKDGTTFWNRLSITPVRDDAGDVTHYIGIQSDVTARRETEQALRRTTEALEQDLRLAARIQQALLPPPEMHLGGYRIAHAFRPCTDLAGDAVGIVPLPHRQVGLYLLDVSGHGVGAALLSFTLNHLLSPSIEGALLVEETPAGPDVVAPARVAERLNRQFPMDRTRQYFTLVYGILDEASGRFRYVMAGHPAPVVLARDAPPAPLHGSGLPIGMIEHASSTTKS